MSVYVRLDDVRAVLKLVGEVREILDAGGCPRTHVLQGLSRLTGAAVSASLSAGGLRAPDPPVLTGYLDHGWSAGERGRVLDYYGTRTAGDDPLMGNLLRAGRREPHVTVRRSDL